MQRRTRTHSHPTLGFAFVIALATFCVNKRALRISAAAAGWNFTLLLFICRSFQLMLMLMFFHHLQLGPSLGVGFCAICSLLLELPLKWKLIKFYFSTVCVSEYAPNTLCQCCVRFLPALKATASVCLSVRLSAFWFGASFGHYKLINS